MLKAVWPGCQTPGISGVGIPLAVVVSGRRGGRVVRGLVHSHLRWPEIVGKHLPIYGQGVTEEDRVMIPAWSRMKSGVGGGRKFVAGGVTGGIVGVKGREMVAGGRVVVQ